AEYAARHGIAPDDRGWLFLTGEHDPVWALIREGFRVAVSRPEPGPLANPLEPIVHSTHFVLVDATGEIRGYYSAFDEEAVNRLLADLARLLATAPRR
ncbi:MAG: SCO family protein, partial [Acidobacteriota bacterium]|nr:SCO family protein [Acidobacteriota bacterium]